MIGANLEIKAANNEMLQLIQALCELRSRPYTIENSLDIYKEHSVILEDALGYTLRIPLETVRSWTVRSA
jgi:hypothetical protein